MIFFLEKYNYKMKLKIYIYIYMFEFLRNFFTLLFKYFNLNVTVSELEHLTPWYGTCNSIIPCISINLNLII